MPNRPANRLPSSVIVTLSAGLAVSLFAFWFTGFQEDQKVNAQFQRDVDVRAISLNAELDLALVALGGVRSLFDASSRVTRGEFSVFVGPLLKHNRGIHALEWIPRVAGSERTAFEAAAQAEGYEGFRIAERSATGEMLVAVERTEYFPVLHVEPFNNNKKVLGFDLASSPERLPTLEQSRDSSEPLATGAISLIQETGRQKGFLAVLPIYSGQPTTVASRREHLKGFVMGLFRVGDLFDAAMARGNHDAGIAMTLMDESAPEADRLLHRYGLEEGVLSHDGEYRKRLNPLAGRQWTMIATPSEKYLAAHRTWLPHLVFFGNLLITLLLARAFFASANRQAEVNRRIEERTRELRDSVAENRAIVDSAVSALLKIDARGTVEVFNPAAERLFGYRADEIVGGNVKRLMPEPFHSAHDGYLDNYRRTRKRKIIGIGREVKGLRKDGSVLPLYLAVGETEVGGEKKYVGFLLDISEQKRAEQMKNEFISTVSHELRTPLTSIKGSLGLALGGVLGTLPPKAVDLLQKALDNTDRLTLLINDILDIEKMQAGRMTFDMKPVRVSALLDKAVSANQGYGERYSVALTVEAGPAAGLTVRGDENRLLQVLSNLISNAIKFSPPQGTVTLACKGESGRVRILVIDRGSGVPLEFQERIFEKFTQADGSSTRSKGGTGLGMAIAKTIVEHHGGTIGFDSRPGEGATFFVDFPTA